MFPLLVGANPRAISLSVPDWKSAWEEWQEMKEEGDYQYETDDCYGEESDDTCYRMPNAWLHNSDSFAFCIKVIRLTDTSATP
jgi:hypothetical protein